MESHSGNAPIFDCELRSSISISKFFEMQARVLYTVVSKDFRIDWKFPQNNNCRKLAPLDIKGPIYQHDLLLSFLRDVAWISHLDIQPHGEA